jgi:hypothetical protein
MRGRAQTASATMRAWVELATVRSAGKLNLMWFWGNSSVRRTVRRVTATPGSQSADAGVKVKEGTVGGGPNGGAERLTVSTITVVPATSRIR